MRHVSIAQLFEDNRDRLLLHWLENPDSDQRIELKSNNVYGADVVGHINVIHPERLQVMGQAEAEWAARIGERRFGQQVQDLLTARPPAMIIAMDEAMESSYCSNAACAAAIEITRVGPDGAPRRTAEGNTAKACTKVRQAATTSPGTSNGSMTWRKRCQLFAPWVAAARSSAGSIPVI